MEFHDSEFANIFDFLQSYNFTISEDSPIEQEVAVDPEMIGKIFETMAFVGGDIGKAHSHGIIYTHRTEITLMCRLALVDRFTNEFGEEHKNLFYELIFATIENDKNIADQKISEQNLWPKIDVFLNQITILDPAVGSGSFLVGMLNILADLKIRSNSQLGIQETIYKVKKNIVCHSLYGVDIMEWAVHVCELRLWLQLVVETDLKPEERTLEPLLPNLDLNVRAGDSLVQQVGDVNFSHLHLTKLPSTIKGKLTHLKGEKRKYFYNDPNREYKSRNIIDKVELDIFKEIIDQQILSHENRLKEMDKIIREPGTQKGLFGDDPEQKSIDLKKTYEKEQKEFQRELTQFISAQESLKDRKDLPFVWDISFAEIFSEEKRGFDIVIGNPPYVRQELIADPKDDPEDFGGENSASWKAAKRVYKEKLVQSVYAAYPDFFHFDIQTKQVKRKLDGKNDLYIYFYLHGLSLLNQRGSFCFITSNSWLDVGYGRDLQEFLLKKTPIKMIMDNQVKRSFQSADINTVIGLFGAPTGAEKSAKFVIFYVPFDECLDAVLFEEINEVVGRNNTQYYRVVNKHIAELLKTGTDKEKEIRIDAYNGDKWGGKYLRAPDIYLTILEKTKAKLVKLNEVCTRSGYIHDNSTGNRFSNTYFIKSIKKTDCIEVRKNDTGVIQYGVKGTGNSRDVAPVLFPRTFGNRHLVVYNPEGVLGKEFYKIFPLKNDLTFAIQMNLTFTILQRELIGLVNLGDGALKFSGDDLDNFELIKELDFSGYETIINSFLRRQQFDINKEIEQLDRRTLDNVIFDALGLTQDERNELYRSVCELVQKRLKKARSV